MRKSTTTFISALALALALTSGCDEDKRRPVGGVCATGADCQSGICAGNLCLDPAGDEDSDGLTNGIEDQIGSDPLANDSDGDGIRDRDELGPNLEVLDADGDGLADIVESAILDEDEDCIPNQYDAEDVVPNSDLSPMRDVVCPDVGVCAGMDRALFGVTCPDGANAECIFDDVPGYEPTEVSCDGLDNNCDGAADEGFADLDGDGAADCVDPDVDGDGVDDTVDNCPATDNPLQEDTSVGGVGDACVDDYDFAFDVTPPETLTAGVPFSVTVALRDGAGDVVTRFSGEITLALAEDDVPLPEAPGDPELSGTTTATAVQGVATFSGVIVTAPGAGLRVVATSGLFAPAESAPFDAVTGDFDRIDLGAAPSPVIAGEAFALVASARDVHDNVLADYRGAITFESTDAAATLPEATTFTEGDAGARSFDFTLRTAGAQTIRVLDAADAVVGTLDATVRHGAVSGFALTGVPSPIVAGEPFLVTISAVDAFGNLVPDFEGAVGLTSSDDAASLPEEVVFAAADAGVVTVEVTFFTAGDHTLAAADVASGDLAGEVAAGVTHAQASGLVVTVLTEPLTAGQTALVEVRVVDEYGNVVTDFTGTVGLTSTDENANLPPEHTFTASDGGVHVFTVVLVSAGEQGIGAANGSGDLSGESPVVVEQASELALAVTGAPTSTTAGVAMSPTIRVTDVFGNTIADFEGVVALSSSDPAAILPEPLVFTTADAGVKTATGVELRTAGTRWLRAEIVGEGVAWQQDVTVAAAAGRDLVVTPASGAAVAGAAFNLTLRIDDAFGNTATGYTGTVSFSSSDSSAVLPAPIAFTAGLAGTTTAPITLRTQGAQTVTASGTALPGTASVQVSRTVSPGALASLVVTPSTATPTAGAGFNVSVSPRDAFGNVIASSVGAATVSTTPASEGPTSATITGVTSIGPFSFTLAGAAQVQVTVGAVTGTGQVTVRPAAPASVAFTTLPASGPAGFPLGTVAVSLRDTFGNTATNAPPTTVTVHLERYARQGRLAGTLSRSTQAGVATFGDLVIDNAGEGWQLAASAGGFTATSPRFDTVWRAPVIVGTPTVTASAGCRYASYAVRQDNARPADVLVEYRVGSGPWRRATQAPSGRGEASGVEAVPTTSSGVAHTFKWDAEADLGETSTTGVQMRVTPSVEGSVGAPASTSTFTINNAFAAKVHALPQPTNIAPAGLAVGDFDRNGLRDIAVADNTLATGVRFTVFYQLAPGAFTATPTTVSTEWQSRYTALVGTPSIGGDTGDDMLAIDGNFRDLNSIVGTRETAGVVRWTVNYSSTPACTFDPEGPAPMPVALTTGRIYGAADAVVACWDDENAIGAFTILADFGQGYSLSSDATLVPGRPYSVAVADLARDGFDDVLVGHANGVAVFPSQFGDGYCEIGPGCLSANLTVGRANHIALGHLDRDGDIDLVVAHDATNVTVVPGRTVYNGQGVATSFFAVAESQSVSFPAAVARVHVVDLDGDGHEDLIAASRAADAVYFLRGDGDLGFVGAPATLSTGGVADGGPLALASADFDRDGRVDLAAVRADTAAATRGARFIDVAARAICEARPDAPAAPPMSMYQTRLSSELRHVDADGKPDLLIGGVELRVRRPGADADVYGHGFAVARGDGGGSFSWETPAYTDASYQIGDAAFGHFDEDDLLDAVVIDGFTDNAYIVRSAPTTDTGWERQPAFDVDGRTGSGRSLIAVGDVDNDGRDDVVYATADQRLVVQHQTAPGSFVAGATPVAVGSAAQGLGLADLDYDGFLDLAFARANATEVCVQMANGSGTYPSAVDPTRCFTDDNVTSAIQLVDLDDDESHELIYVSKTSDSDSVPARVRVRSQDPPNSGVFPELSTLEVCAGASDLAIVDFDGSGRLDIAVGCGRGVKTGEVYFQGEDGGFAGASFDVGALFWDPLTVAAGDLDGDGAEDLALNGAVVGVGSDRLREPMEIPVAPPGGPYPSALWVGDVDQDGLTDIITHPVQSFYTSSATVAVYTTRGRPGGEFASPTIRDLGAGVLRAAAIGEVFGDGRADLVVAVGTSSTANSLRIYRQLRDKPGEFDTFPDYQATLAASSHPTLIALGSVANRGASDVLIRRGASTAAVLELFTWTGGGGLTRRSSQANPSLTIDQIALGRFGANAGRLSPVTAGTCSGDVVERCVVVWIETTCGFAAPLPCLAPAALAYSLPTNHFFVGLFAEDLDADGFDDIVLVTNAGGGQHHHVVMQDPDEPGSFFPATVFPGLPGSASRVTFGDFDGDGLADLLAGSSGFGFVRMGLSRVEVSGGVPGLTPPRPLATALATSAHLPLAIADLDGDGRADVLVHDGRSARVIYGR